MHWISRSFAVGLMAALPNLAAAATYTVDAAHTRVGFKVRHMMVSWVHGEFGTVEGKVDYDPARPEATTVDVTVGIASIDTREKKRDDHLLSPDFFDVEKHTTMTFKSKKVLNAKKDSFDVVGDLTIRGVTREVTLAVTGVTGEIADPWGSLRIGGAAQAQINRQDFGLVWNKNLDAGGYVVGDDVHILLDIELARPKADTAKK